MTVVVLSDCPPSLRGDLTKWLIEINTGVYVGNISARVRDKLWDRICENVKTGRATMVFRTNNEQHMDFRVHNTTWQPVDFDGLKLMRRPAPRPVLQAAGEKPNKSSGSKASAYLKGRHRLPGPGSPVETEDYTVLDLETTGLDPLQDEIIEIAALHIRKNAPDEELAMLVRCEEAVPNAIVELTGITDELLQAQGIPLRDALTRLTEFVGTDTIVCHNAGFDQRFLYTAFEDASLDAFSNRFFDTLALARKKIHKIENYRLESIARYYGIKAERFHRALPDCYTTYGIYINLNKNE